jgi:asparagine synthase (glutamine-hydrolysing)
MCGIGGILSLRGEYVPDLGAKLEVMNDLIAHRGPDDGGVWVHPHGHVGFAHRRLSIIDLEHGHQPMGDAAGRWLTYNGEVYNYPELRTEIGGDRFNTTSDTEVVLRAHDRWGVDALSRSESGRAGGRYCAQPPPLRSAAS